MRLKYSIYFAFVMWLSCLPALLKAQGCSDAGLCTMHALKGTDADSLNPQLPNQLNTGISFGGSQYKVMAFTPTLEYVRNWSGSFSAAVKLGYGIRSGTLHTTYGFSDLTASLDYRLKNGLQIIAGLKIPLNKSDKTYNNLALPMAYQNSLGTLDVLAGLNYLFKDWSFTLAYQQPLTQNNNRFLLEDYPEGSINEKYLSSNFYERAADVMLRVNYTLALAKSNTSLHFGLLPIYHLKNDSYLTALGNREEIEESQGLTLNLNMAASYHLAKNQQIQTIIGAPVISRTARPDGLPQFALSFNYVFAF